MRFAFPGIARLWILCFLLIVSQVPGNGRSGNFINSWSNTYVENRNSKPGSSLFYEQRKRLKATNYKTDPILFSKACQKSSSIFKNHRHNPLFFQIFPPIHALTALTACSQCPRANDPSCSLRFTAIHVGKDSIGWTIEDEKPKGKFMVQRYQYHTWDTIYELPVTDTTSKENYSVALRHLSGRNRYRIKHVKKNGKVRYSEEVIYDNPARAAQPSLDKEKNQVNWELVHEYLLTDCCGNIISETTGSFIDLSRLKPGKHYLFLDNRIFLIRLDKDEEVILKVVE